MKTSVNFHDMFQTLEANIKKIVPEEQMDGVNM